MCPLKTGHSARPNALSYGETFFSFPWRRHIYTNGAKGVAPVKFSLQFFFRQMVLAQIDSQFPLARIAKELPLLHPLTREMGPDSYLHFAATSLHKKTFPTFQPLRGIPYISLSGEKPCGLQGAPHPNTKRPRGTTAGFPGLPAPQIAPPVGWSHP